MRDGRVSLLGLVEAARDRALSRRRIEDWHIEAKGFSIDEAQECQRRAQEQANDIIQLCLQGQFCWASGASRPSATWQYDPDGEMIEWLDDCPAWVELRETIKLAERIDCLLSILEASTTVHPLASDCRDDLGLLRVLADWCQDNGLPRAADEARHLHGLVVAEVRL